MAVLFDALGAAFALAAAVFWFLSARHNPPKIVTYFGGPPENDPFVTWVRSSAVLNRWAALFAGLSALCAVAHFILGALTHQPG
jgi:hypothetical protein